MPYQAASLIEAMLDIFRLCDAWGKEIGFSHQYCPKCKIYVCHLCLYSLMDIQKKFPLVCPMCGGELLYP